MSGRYLLDTNVVIRLFAGNKTVLDWLGKASEIYIPSVVLGELFYGVQKSANVEGNISKIIASSSPFAQNGGGTRYPPKTNRYPI